MIWSNFAPDRSRKEPLYLQLSEFIREEIRQSRALPGTRLPSVRELASGLGLSRTTTETCYSKLAAEGYLVSKPQSGYFVADLEVRPPAEQNFPRHAPRHRFAMISPTIMWTARRSRPSSGDAIWAGPCRPGRPSRGTGSRKGSRCCARSWPSTATNRAVS